MSTDRHAITGVCPRCKVTTVHRRANAARGDYRCNVCGRLHRGCDIQVWSVLENRPPEDAARQRGLFER